MDTAKMQLIGFINLFKSCKIQSKFEFDVEGESYDAHYLLEERGAHFISQGKNSDNVAKCKDLVLPLPRAPVSTFSKKNGKVSCKIVVSGSI